MPQMMVYCSGCRLLLGNCICKFRPNCKTSKHWLLLTHSSEAKKRNNSGFHAKKILGEQVSVQYWQRKQEHVVYQSEVLKDKSPVLLFPKAFTAETTFVSESYCEQWRDQPVVVLDATWQQAKKMYRQSPWLQSLDVWSLPETLPEVLPGFRYQLRKGQAEGGCSTIEVMANVMAMLDEQDSARAMLRYFDLFQSDDNDPSK